MPEPYTKEQQTAWNKPKKEKKGFGQKACVWNNKKKSKKPKIKKYDVIDDEYSRWLGTQPCYITGITAPRGIGANDMHCHHIKGRTPQRNDYEQVPLIGWTHTWGSKSYHSNTKADFIKKNLVMTEDVISYFKEGAEYYKSLYVEQGGIIKEHEENL